MLSNLFGLKSRYPLHIQIAVLFTLLIVSIGTVIIIFGHSQLTKLTEISTNRQYQKTGQAIAAELDAVTRPMMMSVNILASMQITELSTLEQRMNFVGKFIEILKQNTYASAVYSAYPNGDLFMLRRLTDANRLLFHAPEDAEWMIQSNRFLDSLPEKSFIYLDKQQQVIAVMPRDNDNYDPRLRDWFILASASPTLVTSPIYIFKGTGEAGFTYSRQAENKKAIIGLDVSLASLSQFLVRQNLPLDSQAIIINSHGEVIASLPKIKGATAIAATTDKQVPVLQSLLNAQQSRTAANNPNDNNGNSIIFEAQNQQWYGAVVDINNNGNKYQLVIATPASYLTADANSIRNHSTFIAFILLMLSLPIVWYFSRKISNPLIRLRQDADSISNLYFEDNQVERSVIEEVDELHKSMSKMKSTLKQFISMGNMLTSESNFVRQMQGLLSETTEIAAMTGGMIFLADKDEGIFTPTAFRWNGENIPVAKMSSLQVIEDNFTTFQPVLEGKTITGTLNKENILSQLNDFLQPYLPLRFIAVPMKTHDEQLLGFLLLFNPYELNTERERSKIQLVNALVGSLSVSVETQRLLQEQKNLLNAFIQLIAGAIDAKSAYTGGHCQRVPEITKMLAKAAVNVKEGPFADFTLSDNEWEELHTACWLHDCGKITTPEFVVDKSTKLELIYDRIHEVRMRFEVLKREKEIIFLHRHATIMASEADQQLLADELRQLDEDFYFIANCNVGGEFMSDEAIARIQQIARYHWTRTLDDNAGIANEERVRKSRQPTSSLPVQEPMLADKEEHIIYRENKDRRPEYYDFKVPEPTLLYNRGEIYNLSIRRGTLTEEDRYKINEHIMQTIIMLKKLPFPRTMANVPTIAGGHHERMDGKGYPYQLNYTQMSIPVRMMAIADVFEALTAADRPYKPGKLLSEALNIMVNMVNENHLDKEIFILFLQSGIWHEYAIAHLQADKVDVIDVSVLLQRMGHQNITLAETA
ncbi:putative chemotactic transducer-related protein [Yersinia frederiksenii]|uniref:HD domain protein n=2 Tax=Yersinia frederiksenii TaxID=29484 RepID=A0ABR4W705_YERFR|nr:HD domain-containing phosphohydrolase [Yersinia frederiksenii]ATM96303.1 metal-dependent phosphohydrolase [Yersinia frederiksenii]EEQ15229.1 HAMP domain protein [Yersinia frederiksenii ATCC 33641]KGA48340.1 HD domain protein [Yersinia frederiksenii ATCC 33641]CFQ86963.1 putative chemotactic transducer-related protein [Yersinia frederiksenii]CNF12395.1 putative chemotactic transducer-related protein [Yersinia frederiksenii]